MGFLDSSVGEEPPCSAGNPSLIPGLGRSPGEGKGSPHQYSGLENSMDAIFKKKKKKELRYLLEKNRFFIYKHGKDHKVSPPL